MSEGDEIRGLVRELFSRPRFAPQPGLRRMERLLPPAGPWSRLPTLHVTGSNGKGSVATLAAGMLQELGLRVGLYTSPHLWSFNERIRISGEPASSSTLLDAMAWLRPRLEPPVSSSEDLPTAFEAVTALALRVFEESSLDILVAEVGIGGRNAPTRILRGSHSALVSVDLEHTSVLGSTLEEIALDKAEIATPGSTLFLGDLPASLVEVVEEAGRRRGVRVLVPDLSDGRTESLGAAFQRRNGALAAAMVEDWLAEHRPGRLSGVTDGILRACERFRLPGRLEKVRREPEVWLDVAHTPAALRAVAEAVGELAGPRWLVVFGVSADKEARLGTLVEAIEGVADRFFCTRATHRSGSVDAVVRAVEKTGRPHWPFENLGSALKAALETAANENLRVLVTGGLFLAVEAGEILAGRDPDDLVFF